MRHTTLNRINSFSSPFQIKILEKSGSRDVWLRSLGPVPPLALLPLTPGRPGHSSRNMSPPRLVVNSEIKAISCFIDESPFQNGGVFMTPMMGAKDL